MNLTHRPTQADSESVLVPLKQWLRSHGLFYYRGARVVCRMVPEIQAEDLDLGIDIHEATVQELRALEAERNGVQHEWTDRRERGNVCLVARSAATYLGYVWISRSREVMAEVNHVLDVTRDPQGVYLFDGYVFPEHRRKGVLRALLTSCMARAHDRGASRMYAAFARENRASERALLQAGFVTVVGEVSYLLVLGREWKRVRIPRGSPRADILSAGVSSRAIPRPT